MSCFRKTETKQFFNYITENASDHTVVCQVDYAENFTLCNQDQIQSAHWSNKQVSIFTAYAWFGGSGGEGQSLAFMSNTTEHNKYTAITC